MIKASDELTKKLRSERLVARSAIYESMALVRNLALSGRRVHWDREEILRVQDDRRTPLTLRKQLQIHLDYWRAVNRIRTGRDDPLQLEEYELERLRVCDPAEFVTAATAEGGVSGYETRDISVDADGTQPRFVAQNCRLIRGSLRASGLDVLSLAKSALVSVDVAADKIGTFDSSDVAAYAGSLLCEAKVARFVASVFRMTELTIRSTEADFTDSDLAVIRQRNQPDLLELARSSGVSSGQDERDAPVLFVGCDFPNVLFDRSLLQGARFTDCVMPAASFEQANLTDAAFERCDLSDARFEKANLTGVAFEGCDLSKVDFSLANSVADVMVDGVPLPS